MIIGIEYLYPYNFTTVTHLVERMPIELELGMIVQSSELLSLTFFSLLDTDSIEPGSNFVCWCARNNARGSFAVSRHSASLRW